MNDVTNKVKVLTPQSLFVMKVDGIESFYSMSYEEFRSVVISVASAVNAQSFTSADVAAVNVASFLENECFVFLDLATNPGVSVPVWFPVADHAGQKLSIVPYVADASVLTGLAVHTDGVTTINLTTPYYDIVFIADENCVWRRF